MFGKGNFSDYEKYFGQMLIQIIHAFYVEDRETAIYLLQKLKVEYLQNATMVTPTIGKIIKGIIKSLPSDAFPAMPHEAVSQISQEHQQAPVQEREKSPRIHPAMNPLSTQHPTVPTELTNELREKLKPVKKKKEKEKEIIEKLEGSIDDL